MQQASLNSKRIVGKTSKIEIRRYVNINARTRTNFLREERVATVNMFSANSTVPFCERLVNETGKIGVKVRPHIQVLVFHGKLISLANLERESMCLSAAAEVQKLSG